MCVCVSERECVCVERESVCESVSARARVCVTLHESNVNDDVLILKVRLFSATALR